MRFNIAGSFDVVIIGSGISGLVLALELAKSGKSVFIATKEAVTESSSLYAQGGIAVPLAEGDSFENHLKDTLIAGAGLCNVDVAKRIIEFSKVSFEKLLQYGIKFDKDKNGSVHQTKEGAHSFHRVCHVGGDASGRHIVKVLIDNACREPNISILQGAFVLSILKDSSNIAYGILLQDVTKECYVILASDVVIASGGIGQIYSKTSNPLVCTGDGIVMAYRCGAELMDLEMVQFHPTVCFFGGEPFLVTEAIRGEGGKLKNTDGKYFAFDYHRLGDLAPRDILARAIMQEQNKTRTDHVYLCLKSFSSDYFSSRFPTVYSECISRKIDLFGKGIPVTPGAHYFIGGIKTNISGKTNIDHLWALGECASNGFHGANRLASNSLLECVVSPFFLVESLLSNMCKNTACENLIGKNYVEIEYPLSEFPNKEELTRDLNKLKTKNIENIGLTRNEKNLVSHLNWLKLLMDKYQVHSLSYETRLQEFKNMILLSYLITNSALARKYSLGVHCREDSPVLKPEVFEHIITSYANKHSTNSPVIF